MHASASMAVRADPGAFKMSENAGWSVKILVKKAYGPAEFRTNAL
jgi:hypothetical protein